MEIFQKKQIKIGIFTKKKKISDWDTEVKDKEIGGRGKTFNGEVGQKGWKIKMEERSAE